MNWMTVIAIGLLTTAAVGCSSGLTEAEVREIVSGEISALALGPVGPKGDTGSQGVQGLTGTGVQGEPGPQGLQGPIGPQSTEATGCHTHDVWSNNHNHPFSEFAGSELLKTGVNEVTFEWC